METPSSARGSGSLSTVAVLTLGLRDWLSQCSPSVMGQAGRGGPPEGLERPACWTKPLTPPHREQDKVPACPAAIGAPVSEMGTIGQQGRLSQRDVCSVFHIWGAWEVLREMDVCKKKGRKRYIILFPLSSWRKRRTFVCG